MLQTQGALCVLNYPVLCVPLSLQLLSILAFVLQSTRLVSSGPTFSLALPRSRLSASFSQPCACQLLPVPSPPVFWLGVCLSFLALLVCKRQSWKNRGTLK